MVEKDPTDHKYRVCGVDSTKVVFYCEFDQFHLPESTFFGVPIYFQNLVLSGSSFRIQPILGDLFVNAARIFPQSVYLGDLGLKTLCANLHPELVLNNGATIFQTVCEVPIDSVIQTYRSKDTYLNVIKSGTRCATILRDLKRHFPEYCSFGVVGRHTFEPTCDSDEIDLVLFAQSTNQLVELHRLTQSLPTSLSSSYIRRLWPLTVRTTQFGILDFFFHPECLPFPLSEELEQARILNDHYEFDETIKDNSTSILPIPYWKLHDGRFLLSLDTSMRGRLANNTRITGVGLLCQSRSGQPFIVLQDSTNVAML